MVFAIHWHESAIGVHVSPILNPFRNSLPIPSLKVIPVHQPWAPCLMHRTWTGDLFIHISMFSQIILPSPSPSPKVCSLHLCLFCCLTYRVIINIFLNSMWSEMKLLSHVWLFVTPWTVAYQAPPSMEFSRQEYWSGLPCPSPGDLPNPGIEPGSPTL